MVTRASSRGALVCVLLLAFLVPDTPASAAPAQVQRPSERPRGIVLVIHGGAWQERGRRAVRKMRGEARRFRRRGWITHTIDHRRLHRSFTDVRRYYDRLRRRHPRTRICAHGLSSGGHLALMLAERRRSLDCVIAVGAPSDLAAWPAPGGPVPDAARRLARRVSLGRWSPARRAGRIRQPVLLIHDRADAIVPFAQSEALAARLPRGQLVELCPGTVPYVHTQVDPGCLRGAHRAEAALLRRVR